MDERKISASEAKVGMVVTRKLFDQKGRVIMSEGSRLTPALVKRLDKWGVGEIYVSEAPAEESDPEARAKQREEAEKAQRELEQLDRTYMKELAEIYRERFHEVDGNEIMKLLKQIAFKNVVLAGRNKLPGVRIENG